MSSQGKETFVFEKTNNSNDSSWEKFIKKFEEMLFGLIYLILKEDKQPSWLFGLLMVLQTLQNLTFPFDSVVRLVLKLSLKQYGTINFKSTFKYFQIILAWAFTLITSQLLRI